MDRHAIAGDAVTFTRATIAGAGLAGLSAAITLRRAGFAVSIAEAAAQAGGRCRSYHDPQIGRVIDNGNHLVLSGNEAVARFRATIGATVALAGPAHADFVFHDLRDGQSWTVRINDGRVPWWITSRARRVPQSGIVDYLPILRLMMARKGRVDERFTTIGPVWQRLLKPVLLAALNIAPGEGAAVLAGAVLRETLTKGGLAMRPQIAEPSLAAAFIDPATTWLNAQGSAVALGKRLRAIDFDGDRVKSLDWGDGAEPVMSNEAIVLAVPAWVATALLPELRAPNDFRAIVNAHFDFPAPAAAPQMMGLLGGTAEWIFAYSDRLSVTVSAADRLIETDRESLAQTIWGDVCGALAINAPLPRWQIIKEKRATFAATPAQNAMRPPTRTRWRNLFLAGDWIDTGLPATIEGALRSGEGAALAIAGHSG